MAKERQYLLLAADLLLAPQSIPSRLRRFLGRTSATSAQAHRHFITGAQLLSRARSTSTPSTSLAKFALSHADLAIILSPVPQPFSVPVATPLYNFPAPSKRITSVDDISFPHESDLISSVAMHRRSDPTTASASLSNGVSAMVSHSTVVSAYSDLSLKPENLSFSLAMATAATQVPAVIPVTNPAVATPPTICSFISRFSDTLRRSTSDLKPWPEKIDWSAISRPASPFRGHFSPPQEPPNRRSTYTSLSIASPYPLLLCRAPPHDPSDPVATQTLTPSLIPRPQFLALLLNLSLLHPVKSSHYVTKP